jgi:hypothetical protein
MGTDGSGSGYLHSGLQAQSRYRVRDVRGLRRDPSLSEHGMCRRRTLAAARTSCVWVE